VGAQNENDVLVFHRHHSQHCCQRKTVPLRTAEGLGLNACHRRCRQEIYEVAPPHCHIGRQPGSFLLELLLDLCVFLIVAGDRLRDFRCNFLNLHGIIIEGVDLALGDLFHSQPPLANGFILLEGFHGSTYLDQLSDEFLGLVDMLRLLSRPSLQFLTLPLDGGFLRLLLVYLFLCGSLPICGILVGLLLQERGFSFGLFPDLALAFFFGGLRPGELFLLVFSLFHDQVRVLFAL